MPDPFKKVAEGEDVTFSAGQWNAMVDAARAQRLGQHDRTTDGPSTTRSADIVRVKNESGADLPMRAVLGLDAPIFTPSDSLDAFLREVTFRGVVPTALHAGKFCVLLEPAPADRVVRAFVDGMTQVRLDLTDPDHTCADVADGVTDHLVSSRTGSAQIVWAEDEPYGYEGVRWSIIRFGAGCGSGEPYSDNLGRCDCPEDEYEVTVDCGDCGAYYGYYDSPQVGTKMPKYWWVTLSVPAAYSGYYGYGYYGGCDAISCDELDGYRIRMAHDGGCSWSGHNDACVHAELALDGDLWKLTITDREDCVLAVLRTPQAGFNCCGKNSGWVGDPYDSCDISASVEPDPCTCCPDLTCPPDNLPVCSGSPCCYHGCDVVVAVTHLHTPAPTNCQFAQPDPCVDLDGNPCVFPAANCFDAATVPPPELRCSAMNGTYNMKWIKDCTWVFKGYPVYFPGDDPEDPANQAIGGRVKVKATLTLSGKKWTLKLRGDGGQEANFELDAECATMFVMPFSGGTCVHDGQFFVPSAGVAIA